MLKYNQENWRKQICKETNQRSVQFKGLMPTMQVAT